MQYHMVHFSLDKRVGLPSMDKELAVTFIVLLPTNNFFNLKKDVHIAFSVHVPSPLLSIVSKTPA